MRAKRLSAAVRPYSRRLARRVVFPLVEHIWRVAFAVVGNVTKTAMRSLMPSGTENVMLLAPHPDDETLGCGGTIALHLLAGDSVTICIVTDGRQSRAGGLAAGEMKRRRSEEAREAIALLGEVDLRQLDLPEGKWHEEQLTARLVSLIEEQRPTIIYTTSLVDFHPEHIRTARCLADALDRLEAPTGIVVRLYEVQVPLTPLLANMIAYVASVAERKREALAAYLTQAKSLGWVPRYAAYQRRLYRSGSPIEVFCELPAGCFISLCKGARQPWSFRGIHPRPFTDPAAWLAGTRARLYLRRLVRCSFDRL